MTTSNSDFSFASFMEPETAVPNGEIGDPMQPEDLHNVVDSSTAEGETLTMTRTSSPAMKKTATMCGTLNYMALKVYNRRGYARDKADMWSCGIVTFILTMGYAPFIQEDEQRLVKAEYAAPRWFSPLLKDFVSKMLTSVPKDRSSAQDLLWHNGSMVSSPGLWLTM